MTDAPTRTRSLWGWGYADRYEDPEALRRLGQLWAAAVGLSPADPRSPVPLSRGVLEPSRATPPRALSSILHDASEERARHAYGRAYYDIVRGFRGDFRAAPDLVAMPETVEEVRRILDFCHDADFAVVPYGGGTSVVRGVECPREEKDAVVSLDLRRLNRILEVSVEDRTARIEAGVLGPALEEGLKAHGLTLRHYPQSFEFSTLGGWIATRAGGHFATLSTRIDDLVSSVRMLSPSGELATVDLPATGAGPEPKRWVLGSEGVFGVIVDARVRVRPRAIHRGRVAVRFSRFEDGVRACRELARSDLHPSNCRLLEGAEARLNGVDASGQSLLLLAFESADHPVDAWMTRGVEIARSTGGELKDAPRLSSPDREEKARDAGAGWKAAFINAPYLQSQFVALGVLVDTFETCTTWSSFEALDAALRERLRPLLSVGGREGLLTCRFTHVYPDGPAPYYTFTTTVDEGAELAKWQDIKSASLEVLEEHGATVTHHHAVGRTHRAAYHRELGETGLTLLRGAKAAVDPRGVMNPGVLL